MRNALILLAIALLSINIFGQTTTEGTLYAVSKKGAELGTVPLKDTKVNASISGFIARINVRQEFTNSFAEPIEAVYTFPLSQNGAVDAMTMTIGTRVIHGKIMKRDEARAIYETAKAAGQTASLLDQERPNIFTQAVANIMPGESVIIDISYVETLKYEDGSYEFVFPMTVGPRYIPSGSDEEDTEKITPPVSATRVGHDVAITVNLNAGVPVQDIHSTSHQINELSTGANTRTVNLKSETTIPNKDFVLRYDVTGSRMEDAVLTTRNPAGGFFSLILSPPERLSSEDRTPKEIVFVLDTSGSMEGFPIEKAKELVNLTLDGLYPEDTFNLITFAGETEVLFPEPVPATQGNMERAREFLKSRKGDGGTEMMDAIKAALVPSDSREHLRIVCFITDGEVGNDMEVIAEVKKYPKARVFSFGIGDSVNRFLLDNIAKEGRGDSEYVLLADEGSKAARKFYERIRNPYLTDISIDWKGLPVTEVYPRRIPDLFGAKPVVIFGKYNRQAGGKIVLKGNIGGQPFERVIDINLPSEDSGNRALASLWARTKIDELMSISWDPENEESDPKPAARNAITKLGLDHNLVTQFTSFVAVEERIVTRMRNGKRVRVPVYAPAGTVFEDGGTPESGDLINPSASVTNLALSTGGGRGTGSASGIGSGSGSGIGHGSGSPPPSAAFNKMQVIASLQSPPAKISGGVMNGKATNLPKPPYPAAARAVKVSGSVSIQVTVDESGNIIAASAVSGHPLLLAAAEQAAKGAKFSPTMMSGQPVKVTGVITYNFVNPNDAGNIQIATGELSPETSPQTPPTAEMLREQLIKDKLHSWVYALFDRTRKNVSEAAPNESAFVKDAQAHLEIVLTSRTQALLDQLAAIGFTIIKDDKAKTITGHIAIDKIGSLAELTEIKLVLPRP